MNNQSELDQVTFTLAELTMIKCSLATDTPIYARVCDAILDKRISSNSSAQYFMDAVHAARNHPDDVEDELLERAVALFHAYNDYNAIANDYRHNSIDIKIAYPPALQRERLVISNWLSDIKYDTDLRKFIRSMTDEMVRFVATEIVSGEEMELFYCYHTSASDSSCYSPALGQTLQALYTYIIDNPELYMSSVQVKAVSERYLELFRSHPFFHSAEQIADDMEGDE